MSQANNKNTNTGNSNNNNNNIAEAFKKHGIVPDIIAQPPASVLQVQYDDSNVNVNLGAELTPTQVKNQPKITLPKYNDDETLYTLLMLDPDAPSRINPANGEIRHWLVGNIPAYGQVADGDTIAEYVGSGPPQGSGLHRYIFLLFKQSNGQKIDFKAQNETFSTKTSREGRVKTNTKNLIEKYGLELPPVAGNFYQAQYDDYVPQLHKQMGFVPTPQQQ